MSAIRKNFLSISYVGLIFSSILLFLTTIEFRMATFCNSDSPAVPFNCVIWFTAAVIGMVTGLWGINTFRHHQPAFSSQLAFFGLSVASVVSDCMVILTSVSVRLTIESGPVLEWLVLATEVARVICGILTISDVQESLKRQAEAELEVVEIKRSSETQHENDAAAVRNRPVRPTSVRQRPTIQVIPPSQPSPPPTTPPLDRNNNFEFATPPTDPYIPSACLRARYLSPRNWSFVYRRTN